MCSLCGEWFRDLRWVESIGYWLCGSCAAMAKREECEDEAVCCATEGWR